MEKAAKLSERQHDATLPFTRMLAGHADYTPVLFGERRNDTTWGASGGHRRCLLFAAVDLRRASKDRCCNIRPWM